MQHAARRSQSSLTPIAAAFLAGYLITWKQSVDYQNCRSYYKQHVLAVRQLTQILRCLSQLVRY